MFDARAWKISRPFYVDGQIARMPRFPRDLENERRRAATFQFIPLPVRSSHIGSDLVEI